MRRLFLLCLMVLFAGPAPAQEWRSAPEYDVLLTSFDIEPRIIHLKAGEPVRLRFVNNTHQRHSFSARAFFRDSRLRGRDSTLVANGVLAVPPLSTRTIVLVPKLGRYRAGSSNRIHRLRGMTARIVAD